MQKSIITKTWLIDFHRFLILIDKFWLITIDFNRGSKISICYFLIMYKSKFIKIRIAVNPRQKCTICGQTSLPRVSWQGTTLPINVKGVWGGGGQIPCPPGNHSSQMHKNFLELISFIRVATVREKSGKNKNFSRSGKSQGTLFSDAMHQGWQWAFKGKIKPLNIFNLMEFSVLKIELLFTLIQQFIKRLVDPSAHWTKKDSDIPSPRRTRSF